MPGARPRGARRGFNDPNPELRKLEKAKAMARGASGRTNPLQDDNLRLVILQNILLLPKMVGFLLNRHLREGLTQY